MKKFTIPLIVIAGIMWVTGSVVANDPVAPEATQASELDQTSNHHAADTRLLYAALIRPGPNWKQGAKPSEQVGFAEHFATLQRLQAEGVLVLAGPFQDDRGGGLTVIRADNLEAAKTIIGQDPFVKSKMVIADVRQWYAALGTLPADNK